MPGRLVARGGRFPELARTGQAAVPCPSAVPGGPAARLREWRAQPGLNAATERELGSGPAYSRYFKQIAKAVVLHRP